MVEASARLYGEPGAPSAPLGALIPAVDTLIPAVGTLLPESVRGRA